MDDRKKWDEYEYPHKKVFAELFESDQSKLPTELRQQLRGFDMGLKKIKDNAGFERLVTLSGTIAHDMQDHYQKDVTAEAKPEEKPAPPPAQPAPAAPAAPAAPDPAEKHIIKPTPAPVPDDDDDYLLI